MFYNDNNWNLIAQIIYKLHNEPDIIRKISSFKTLTGKKRAEILADVSKRLGACGFPDNTKADTFENLTVCLSEEELPEHLMEALHYIDMILNHNNDTAVFMLDRTISVSQMRKLNKNEDKLGIMISKGFDAFIKLTNIGIISGCRIVWCNSCAVRHLYDNKEGIFNESDICCMGVSGARNYFPAKPEVKCKNGQCAGSCLFYIDIPLSTMTKGVGENLYWNHLIS